MHNNNGQDYGGYGMYDYDPTTDEIDFLGTMTTYPDSSSTEMGRWYPTAYQLPNRHVLIMSGTRFVDSDPDIKQNRYWEIFAPTAGAEPSFVVRLDDMARPTNGPYYPHVFMHPTNGDLIVCGNEYTKRNATYPYAEEVTSDASYTNQYRRFNLQSLAYGYVSGTYLERPSTIQNARVNYPSGVMVDGNIYRTGGSGNGSEDGDGGSNAAVPSIKKGIRLNLYGATNEWWSQMADMLVPRKNHTLVALPDGNILAMGGNEKRNNSSLITGDIEAATPELYKPTADSWLQMETPPVDSGEDPQRVIGRPYHSVALLLPDARVIIAGGELEGSNETNNPRALSKRSAHIFSPPYANRNDWASDRPAKPDPAGSGTAELYYGEAFQATFNAPSGRNVNRVVLISLGSTTHAFNCNQHVYTIHSGSNLTLNQSISLNAPANPNLCPPGYYMMFAVDTYGIPSEAEIVLLKDLDMFVPFSGGTLKVLGQESDSAQLAATRLRIGDNKYLGGTITSDIDNDPAVHVVAVESELTGDLSGSSASKIRAQVECSVTSITGGAPQLNVYAYNWSSSTWVSMGSTVSMTTSDAQYEFVKTSGLSNLVTTDSGHEKMKFRIEWTRSTSFTVKFDKLEGGTR